MLLFEFFVFNLVNDIQKLSIHPSIFCRLEVLAVKIMFGAGKIAGPRHIEAVMEYLTPLFIVW